MLGQAPLPKVKPPPALQFETNRAALDQDAISQCRSRFLWASFGFAVFMLFHQSLGAAWNASAKPSHHVVMVALNPFRPVLAPARIRSATPVISEWSMGNADLVEENKVHKEEVQHDLGETTGSLQRSSLVMSAVLDAPKVRSPQFSKQMERARANLERQFAQPPSPPPPPPDDDDFGGRGGEETWITPLSVSEACTVLDDWITRVLVSSPFAVQAPIHSRATLQQLESLRLWIEDGPTEHKVVVGLVNEHTPRGGALAIAAGRVSASHMPRDTFKVDYISVRPSVEAGASIQGALAMKQALGTHAEFLGLTVVFDNVKR